ncbi:MAG TPA: formate--tetrahydrofolate ligase [Methylococcaceae bacterium]|jgi:formate--tetrahydrofolate ligase|nr:formate--tetrahydrofolate ligase [Methylococcaceae bacterium]HIN68005.1 formate--tetrahydrofolate ligase [Methylococcales bacterium]HIA45279.1 formate--tetrahydrofolate ligase [Methylococcaceae bacterium]HIB62321.1 formate--tetrahydrofolate ligase [Methylococcaceae bacterium]HIO13219.1 formate--tetrahydrofolate ligase [Methylococcales bacterium]
MSDIEIAQHASKKPILALAKEQYDIDSEHLDPFGHYKAKLSLDYIDSLADRPDGKLILVTAISPTPAGEGKTTTTVGLTDAMNRLGKKTICCLREPSLGPCFGIKGGATGGGYSQVIPMEDINLHFTGDFHAIGVAHNLLSALIDNHIHHGNALAIDTRRIQWKRVVDMNDRALRNITVGMGGPLNGFVRSDGYDIVVASEVMAILCLATSRADLKERLGRIIIGYKNDGTTPIIASDLKAQGAMAVLLKDAIKPNLVQTLENNIALIHGGPFANIAHGCNTVTATKTALKIADYTVTEAGFGADLGAEKFINIKCRKSGITPSAVVLVATLRALKFHGGIDKGNLNNENLEAVKQGFENLERHYNNVTKQYGLPCVICINHFTFDTEEEIQLLQDLCQHIGAQCIVSKHWAQGGGGALQLAEKIVDIVDNRKPSFNYVYDNEDSLWDKITAIATKLYGASEVTAPLKIRQQISRWEQDYGSFPVCIAKTQMSFSTDPTAKGAPSGHTLEIREVRLANGAEFMVAIAGNMMTMPGLPKTPAAERIDIEDDGTITGLF